MQAPRDPQQRAASGGAPSLFGASPKPAAANDELRILSVLEPPAPRQRSRWLWPAALGVAAATCTGIVLWRANASNDVDAAVVAQMAASTARAASAAAQPASAVRVASAQETRGEAPSSSAAIIETLPQAAEAAGSAPAPALAASPAASSPLALLAAEGSPASAPQPAATTAEKPAAHEPVKVHAKANAHHTHVASAHVHHKPAAKARPKNDDADVDLLEAMVAHVRGQAVPAHDKMPAAAPQTASKP